MGVYFNEYPNPCPRCGGTVRSTFISVTPMTYSMGCGGCQSSDFSDEEIEQLGTAYSTTIEGGRLNVPTWEKEPDEWKNGIPELD